VTISSSLTLYIGSFAPTISPPWFPPHPTEANCKMFHHFISYVCKLINHIPYLHLHHLPSFLTQVPTHTYCIEFTLLSSIFNSKVNIQSGFSIYLSCEYTLLWSVQHPLFLSLTLSLLPPIIQKISVHIVMFSTMQML
jgi:hypothetical protein